MKAWALGLAWGAVVAAPIVSRAQTRSRHARAAALVERREPAGTRPRWRGMLARQVRRLVPEVVVRVACGFAQRRRARRDTALLEREMPIAVDLLAVGVGSGLTPFLAVEATAASAPPRAAAALLRVVAAVHAGRRFADALDAATRDAPPLRPLADALLASERLGAPVVPALLRVAAEARAQARRRAEIRARAVPVRLLFPLVFLVLPAFGLLTVVPAVAEGFTR